MNTTNILKSLRAMKGLTQRDMAEILNMTVQTYNRKELGQREFTLEESKVIANIFGKTIEEIFFNQQCNTNGTKFEFSTA